MKAFLFSLSLFLVLPVQSAEEIRVEELFKFYELPGSSSPGKRFPATISRATLRFQSNQNDWFFLNLYRQEPFPDNGFVLVVPNKVPLTGEQKFPFSAGGSPSSDGEYHASLWWYGADNAEELIRLFNPQVLRRRHPGHRMMTTFLPAKNEFEAGEPVLVTLRITNVGDAEFAFEQGGKQRGSRDNQFAFSAEDRLRHHMLPDIGSPTHMGGLVGSIKIPPGESHELEVDLTRWFAFQKGGFYRIRGSYSMPITEKVAKDPFAFCVWEDFACAEFGIKMKD